MALRTFGSPFQRANPKTATPATRPTSIPRMSRLLTISVVLYRDGSVTGETEKVARVVHPLVQIVPADQRRGSLVTTHHVDEEQHENPSEDGPRCPLPNRDGNGFYGATGKLYRIDHDLCLLWNLASQIGIKTPPGLTPTPVAAAPDPITVARPYRILTDFRTTTRSRNPFLSGRSSAGKDASWSTTSSEAAAPAHLTRAAIVRSRSATVTPSSWR